MEFTFRVKETFYQIWASMEEVGKDRGSFVKDENYEPQEYIYSQEETAYRLTEEEFQSFAHIIVAPCKGYMTIITAWSGQSYSFNFRAKSCNYAGAFQGFLQQDLFPKITAQLTGKEAVCATNFAGSLAQYVAKKQTEAAVKSCVAGYVFGLERLSAEERHEKMPESMRRMFAEPRTFSWFDEQGERKYKTEETAGSWLIPWAFKKFALKAAPKKVQYECNEYHDLRSVNGCQVGYIPRHKKEEYASEVLTTYSITI